MSKQFCFCTLAVGKRYRLHAQILAKDIQKHSPNTSFVVLTDQPADFREFSHVVAFKHQLQSVKGYHDKRFVLEKSLKLFETCIFLDSDVRIIGPVPEEMEWQPGITARTGCNILEHNAGTKKRKALPIIQDAAEKLDIDLQETPWFHEFMFTLKKQDGAEANFFETWRTLAYFFEMKRIYDGEGNVMGLAAAKAGLTVRYDTADRFPFFKDNIERERIKRRQSELKHKQEYFNSHRQIEAPKRFLATKIADKVVSKFLLIYRLGRLNLLALSDVEFQEFFLSKR